MEFKDFMKQKTVLFDGAMGTQIQKLSADAKYMPDEWSIRMPEAVERIHLEYLQSGADVITTNTFGANRYKCADRTYSPAQLIQNAVRCAQNARTKYQRQNKRPVYIALDIGPIGALLKPSGHLEWDEAYEIYKEQVLLGVQFGVDILLIETQTDLAELKCAVLACKEHSTLPILCSMSFEQSGRTFTGTDVLSMATTLEYLGVDAIGFNCSFGAHAMRPLVDELLHATNLPIIVQPNFSLPNHTEGLCQTDTSFVEEMKYFVEQGVEIIGGCCGTTPQTIQDLSDMLSKTSGTRIHNSLGTRVCSYAKTVPIGQLPKVVGERINPAGKRAFQEELRNGKLDYALREAILQVQEGADILDVNVGSFAVDETELLPRLIREIQSILEIPLQIDSTCAEAIEASARYYNGKPLINSVNGKEESLQQILPIAKKYGACVLGLTLDEEGIPKSIDKRLEIAKKILNRALAIGIPKENVLIDCLTLTISTDPAVQTKRALKLVKEQLNLCTTLGVSNISFGLPNRTPINHAFLISALEHGLDLPIINTKEKIMMEAVDSYCVLSGKDAHAKRYIEKYSQSEIVPKERVESMTLEQAIINAQSHDIDRLIQSLLHEKEAMEIIEQDLLPILNKIGMQFEEGILFLPQLIQTSQAIKRALDQVKAHWQADPVQDRVGKILLATVEHDVHDIGKNIVKVLLENYGFEVFDMGKDVPPLKIVECCQKNHIELIGLSALMTTTIPSMEKTIRMLKQALPNCYIIAGGAVLNRQCAEDIGADAYAKHPSETVRLASRFYGKDSE